MLSGLGICTVQMGLMCFKLLYILRNNLRLQRLLLYNFFLGVLLENENSQLDRREE